MLCSCLLATSTALELIHDHTVLLIVTLLYVLPILVSRTFVHKTFSSHCYRTGSTRDVSVLNRSTLVTLHTGTTYYRSGSTQATNKHRRQTEESSSEMIYNQTKVVLVFFLRYGCVVDFVNGLLPNAVCIRKDENKGKLRISGMT